jgi:hypothetical protein
MFAMEALWTKVMKSSYQNLLCKLPWIFNSLRRYTVVPVISTIETGFALPAVADFEKLITPKQRQS